jgi:conjugative relaxase-like TrwC/TraI family protein
MLTSWVLTSASGAKNYYNVGDYFTEGQEVAGICGGKLAAKLGLPERLSKEQFDRLCDGQHPLTGEQLTARLNDYRRVGTDFVFSGTKAFSVLTALADEAERQRLRAAFDKALTETVAEMEGDMQTRVRKDGADHDRTTGNGLYNIFHHTTARPEDGKPPDMHEHGHVVWFNFTEDEVEERIKAGQFGNIKRDCAYFEAAFDARLAAALKELGYGIERRGGKDWGIAGIDRSLELKFSKRTGEINAEHEERLRNDPGYQAQMKHELGAKTRSKKQKSLTPEELRDAWKAQLTDDERDALAAVYRHEASGSEPVTARQAVEYAIAHCSERLSVLPERELVRVALLHGLGDVSAESVRAEMERQGVILQEIDGRMMATTEGLQAEELTIARIAEPGQGVLAVGVPEGLKSGHLNDGQFAAVVGLLESPSRVNLIEGPAGAGKSSLLSAYDRAMHEAGEQVIYLASTAKAVGVLRDDGFKDTQTLARFLLDEKMQTAAKGCRVVVDESSMIGHKDAVKLFGLAEKLDLKLILVGDRMQHGSVARGALHKLLTKHAHICPFMLSEIMRQDDAEYRQAAKLLSEGETLAGLDILDGKGWVKEINGDAERCQAIAADYVRALEDFQTVPENQRVLVVSPTHAEAAAITAAIRAGLREAGRIKGDEREFTRLVAADATEAERGQALTYRPGDVIQFHQNAKGGFTKGDRLTVADPKALPLSEAGRFGLFRTEGISLAAGDRIRFTATVKTTDGEHKLTNGDTHTVAGFTDAGDIRLKNGWVVAKDAGHFRHAFVETSFGSQGQTVKRVILGMAAESVPAMNQEQLYVSATRGRESVTIFTDDKEAVRRAVQRSSQKLAALDLVVKKPDRKRVSKDQGERDRRMRIVSLQRVRDAWQAEAAQARRAAEHARTPERGPHGYGR